MGSKKSIRAKVEDRYMCQSRLPPPRTVDPFARWRTSLIERDERDGDQRELGHLVTWPRGGPLVPMRNGEG